MSIESGGEIGYLYCLSNPAMPGLVKIGYTNRHTAIRAEELSFGSRGTNATGVPLPFDIVKDWRVPAEKSFEVEQLVHKRLHAHRVASHGKWKAKEFFRLVPSEAIERIEGALRELDWWGVTQAQQSQFDAEVRARAARAKIDRRTATLQARWWSGVQADIRKGQGNHYSATTERLKSAGAMIGFKWAAIWFFGSMIVLFGMANAKDDAIWLCVLFGAMAFYFTKDGAAEEYRRGDQYRAEQERSSEQTIALNKQSIETECPNDSCKKTLIFSIEVTTSAANVRCPACRATFKWQIPDS